MNRDMIRPSEVNGCTVQRVDYLDEIDDEIVLAALQKLRCCERRAVEGVPKQQPGVPTTSRDDVVDDSIPGLNKTTTRDFTKQSRSQQRTSSTQSKNSSINWNWAGSMLSHINCAMPFGEGAGEVTDKLSLQLSEVYNRRFKFATKGDHFKSQISIPEQSPAEQTPGYKRLPSLSGLIRHFGTPQQEKNGSINDTTNTEISLGMNPDEKDSNSDNKLYLKFYLQKLVEGTTQFIERQFGGDESIDVNDFVDEATTMDETYADSKEDDETMTSTEETQDAADELQRDAGGRFRSEAISQCEEAASVVSMEQNGPDDEDGSVESDDTFPKMLVVAGYDPETDDCSLLSNGSRTNPKERRTQLV